MLNEVLRHIRNYFPDSGNAQEGVFTIEDSKIDLPFVRDGQYYLIEGSVFNDGIHKEKLGLTDEEFEGRVTPLKIPKAVLELSEEIAEYEEKNGTVSPYTSESFGGYSYSKATNSNGVAVSWKEAFASKLRSWRKA